MSRQVIHDGQGAFQVRFAFDRRLVDLVKTLANRRWNAEGKYWRVPDDDVVPLVDLLREEGFSFDEETKRLYASRGGVAELAGGRSRDTGPILPGLFDDFGADAPRRAGATATSRAGTDYTVTRLNSEVKAALAAAFPVPVWVVGEISGFNKSAHRRIVGFHLVERDPSGRSLAEVNAVLFEETRREIERRLAAAGDPFRLEDEITVRARAAVELYEPWGQYRLRIEEVDLTYTLGEAARRREEIVRRLTEEGLATLNTSLPFPELPLRLGLVTSLGSDAYNDVLRTLQESGFAFVVTAHGARVQGRSTEPSVLNALDWFREHAEELDAILICRGGGSRIDLAWFDSEPIGRTVATFPLPVVIGIGHEQDLSVLDFVGWRCKTPTAAAAFVVQKVQEALDRVEEAGRQALSTAAQRIEDEKRSQEERALRLARAAAGMLDRARSDLAQRRLRTARGARSLLASASRELARRGFAVPRAASLLLERMRVLVQQSVRQLVQGTRRDLAAASRHLVEMVASLGPRGLRRLGIEKERSEARARRLHLVDPRRVVERGYAILREGGGGVVTDAAAAPAGTVLRAELRRGALRLRSEGAAIEEGGK